MKERKFWLMMLLTLVGGSYAYKRYFIEKDRLLQWNRTENFQNIPAHHFSNRGGVIIEK
jgi:hypothetical protein